MPDQSVDLTSLVGSRICHDLISPLGAIGNGVELLELAGHSVGPEMRLIAQSVESANARIRYFRVAFGAASARQSMGRREILSILDGYGKGGRVKTDWQPIGDCLRSEVKLAFLLLQCLETSMPYGGKVTVSLTDRRWTLRATGAKLLVTPDLWDVLATPATERDISAAHVQFALAPDLLKALGRRSQIELSETEICIRV
ncbi:histidine phosphotransferase family protein [Pseudogemmobacter sp. W21_MBD1_M6]|uniref:histidine phosphotransferase family protein n=1 Tax=Pseudogemmobacter sp. W21_MBD1_M6 TaxID=3240271 RepID=UPI003F965A8B